MVDDFEASRNGKRGGYKKAKAKKLELAPPSGVTPPSGKPKPNPKPTPKPQPKFKYGNLDMILGPFVTHSPLSPRVPRCHVSFFYNF